MSKSASGPTTRSREAGSDTSELRTGELPTGRTLRARGLLVILLVAISMIFGGYVAKSALPTNALHLPAAHPAVVRVLVPEGWAFFTRDPREADMSVWTVSAADDTWVSLRKHAHAAPSNLFGIRRTDGAAGIEMGLVYVTALQQKTQWQQCEPTRSDGTPGESLASCLDSGPVTSVLNPTPRPQLCGAVGLSRQAPLPWAWAAEGVEEQMPIETMRLEVTCTQATR